MDKALEDTGLHMHQMATAMVALILGLTEHPSVKVVAVNQPNVGKELICIPFIHFSIEGSVVSKK